MRPDRVRPHEAIMPQRAGVPGAAALPCIVADLVGIMLDTDRPPDDEAP
jgi:hypothetical protein